MREKTGCILVIWEQNMRAKVRVCDESREEEKGVCWLGQGSQSRV